MRNTCDCLPCLQGIKNVPKRLRVVIQRKRNEDDEDSVSAHAAAPPPPPTCSAEPPHAAPACPRAFLDLHLRLLAVQCIKPAGGPCPGLCVHHLTCR